MKNLITLLSTSSLFLSTSIIYGREIKRPNILVILTDQLAAGMSSFEDNNKINTPAIDQLISEGVSFKRAYASNPVSVASRFSLLTGTMPSVIGMETNNEIKNYVPDSIRKESLGYLIKNVGYETVYIGKKHLTGKNRSNGYENPYAYGFDKYLVPEDIEGRDKATNACENYLSECHTKPFFIYLSLINPHDICYKPLNEELLSLGKKGLPKEHPAMKVISRVMPDSNLITRDFIINKTPQLPYNFEISKDHAPEFRNNAGYLKWASENYSKDDWRIYRYLYNKLIEDVDRQISSVLKALKKYGYDENTLVIFTSDHGEMNGAHKMPTKGVLYEESAKIPFIFRWKGIIPEGKTNEYLVSNGLDLLPTICDFAGVKTINKIGFSLKPIIFSQDTKWRDNLVIESERSRAIIFDKYWKYMIAYSIKNDSLLKHEVLINLNKDPGEMKNFSNNKKMLIKGRHLLLEWYNNNNIKLSDKYIIEKK